MAGVAWPTTVTRKMGAGPSCVVESGFWLADGVCAMALPAARLATTNSIDEVRMDINAGLATSGPARKRTLRHPIAGLPYVNNVVGSHFSQSFPQPMTCSARRGRSRRVRLRAPRAETRRSPPSGAIEARRAQVRAQGAPGEERHNIEGVEPGTRRRHQPIDPRLVRDVTGLDADIHEHDAGDQSRQRAAECKHDVPRQRH